MKERAGSLLSFLFGNVFEFCVKEFSLNSEFLNAGIHYLEQNVHRVARLSKLLFPEGMIEQAISAALNFSDVSLSLKRMDSCSWKICFGHVAKFGLL